MSADAAQALYEKLRDASQMFGVMRQEPFFSTSELDELVRLAAAASGRCSRCTKVIERFVPPDAGGMTAGYYVAAAWAKYTNPGEVYVCESCVWSDPRYIADYGDNRSGK